MMMMGLEFTGQEPFHTVYLHGLVRDEQGRKMSKTLGNVIDPLNVMDEFGTDALRFTLLVGSTPGQDINLSLEKVGANRNFANKLWNAARFVTGALPSVPKKANVDLEWTLADGWIWARLKQLLESVERLFANYQYGEAGRQIYEFFWSEFADWYIEIAKLQLAEGGDRAFRTADLLVRVLDSCLRLLHPFTPFVTEELWGHLKAAAEAHSAALKPEGQGPWPEALIVAEWPEPQPADGWEEGAMARFAVFQDVVRGIRNLRAEKGVKPGQKLAAMVAAGPHYETFEHEKRALAALAQLDPERLTIAESISERPEGAAAVVAGAVEVLLPLADLVDPAAERSRLEKELAEARGQLERVEKLLASDFVKKAPAAVVEKERARLAGYEQTVAKLQASLNEQA
jgi:valyl-tRNA synthetase